MPTACQRVDWSQVEMQRTRHRQTQAGERVKAMALDRIINWQKRKPTQKQLGWLLADFVADAGQVKWIKDRYCVELRARSSPCLRRMEGVHAGYVVSIRDDVRWIEVWSDQECTYVMTRQQDEFTNAIAVGLVEVLARFWEGKIEG